MTGIFIPQRFRPQQKFDLIVYLHGIKTKPDLTIDRYWNKQLNPHFALREGLNQSQKNAILVAPTLGPRSQTQTGWLTQPGGFDRYVDAVRAALRAYGPYQNSVQLPEIGDIILACHSGGGLPMRNLALGKNRYANHIVECWGFDCLYFTGDEKLWASWAKARPRAKLFVHYQGSTRQRSEALRKNGLPNIAVTYSKAKGHNWVPIHHWQERLSGVSSTSTSTTANEFNFEVGGALPPNITNPLALTVRLNAVALATQELNRWNKATQEWNRRNTEKPKPPETNPKMRSVLTDYWRTGVGYLPSQANWWSSVPWSAAFISWVMKKSGAGKDFKYAGAHAVYTAAAKANRLANNSNMFKAYRISEIAPRVGDIVCKSRGTKAKATYDNIKPGLETHCDIVVSVEPNRLVTIGGNVRNSVSQTIVNTDANGLITNSNYFAVIRVGD